MHTQGDIYLAELDPTVGSEQAGVRPVVIVSGNSFNQSKRLVMTCPATTKIKNYYWDVVVQPSKTNGLTEPTEILVFQVRTIATQRLGKKIWCVSPEEMDKILTGITDILRY